MQDAKGQGRLGQRSFLRPSARQDHQVLHANCLPYSAMNPYRIVGSARHEVCGANMPRCKSSTRHPRYRQQTAQHRSPTRPRRLRLQTPSYGSTTSPTPARQSRPPVPIPLTRACGPNPSLQSPSTTPWFPTPSWRSALSASALRLLRLRGKSSCVQRPSAITTALSNSCGDPWLLLGSARRTLCSLVRWC